MRIKLCSSRLSRSRLHVPNGSNSRFMFFAWLNMLNYGITTNIWPKKGGLGPQNTVTLPLCKCIYYLLFYYLCTSWVCVFIYIYIKIPVFSIHIKRTVIEKQKKITQPAQRAFTKVNPIIWDIGRHIKTAVFGSQVGKVWLGLGIKRTWFGIKMITHDKTWFYKSCRTFSLISLIFSV